MVFPNICWYHQISSSWHWMVCMVSSVNCGARIGTGEVIKGWDEGLLRMSQGEKATLGVRSDYAYGALPCRCLGYLGIWGADTWNLGEARDVGWFFGTKQGKSSFFSGCWFHPLEFAARRIEESRLVVHREWRSILIQYFYVCMSAWMWKFFGFCRFFVHFSLILLGWSGYVDRGKAGAGCIPPYSDLRLGTSQHLKGMSKSAKNGQRWHMAYK